MLTTRRPPGLVTRASSLAKAASSGTCSSMSTTATRSKLASGKGRRSPRTRWTSSPTSERIEETASSVRSPEAHAPPRSRSSRLTTPLSEPRSRQRRPAVGPSIPATSASLLCLRTERRKSATAHSRALAGSATALQPQDDGGAEGPREAERRGRALEAAGEAGRAEPPVEGHREEELRPAAGGRGSRARRTPARPRASENTVNGRVFPSTPFFRPKKRSATALTLRRVG